MTVFEATFYFKDASGLDTTRTLVLQDISGADLGAEFLTATNKLTATQALWQTLTKSQVYKYTVRYNTTFAGAAQAGALNQDTVNANVWTTKINPNGQRNTAQINVPAVLDGVMLAATGEQRNQLDVNDADWQAFVADLAANYSVSDGEIVDTAIATAGTKDGYRTTKSKSFRT